jgi:hypothetical protein
LRLPTRALPFPFGCGEVLVSVLVLAHVAWIRAPHRTRPLTLSHSWRCEGVPLAISACVGASLIGVSRRRVSSPIARLSFFPFGFAPFFFLCALSRLALWLVSTVSCTAVSLSVALCFFAFFSRFVFRSRCRRRWWTAARGCDGIRVVTRYGPGVVCVTVSSVTGVPPTEHAAFRCRTVGVCCCFPWRDALTNRWRCFPALPFLLPPPVFHSLRQWFFFPLPRLASLACSLVRDWRCVCPSLFSFFRSSLSLPFL